MPNPDSTLELQLSDLCNEFNLNFNYLDIDTGLRKNHKPQFLQTLLSLYQKELEQAMDERDKHCAKHGHIILRGEAAKRYLGLTGEQP